MILNPCLLGAWQCNTDMLRSQGVFHLFLGRGASRGLQLRHAFLLHPSHKRSFSSSAEEYLTLRAAKEKEIQNLAEVREDVAFEELLRTSSLPAADAFPLGTGRAHTMTRDQVMRVLEAGFVTSLLHCESRVAALLGEGFYTIGPGGEELLAAAGVPIQEQDLTALHYRHVGTQIARHLGMGIGVDEIIMNRARAHTVSSADIVTGGAHCSLGGTPRDFLVTSTLSSQCTPAVGRALGIGLSHGLKNLQPDVDAQFAVDAVSYVSLGDGSTHNAHFLSAVNLTDYARNRGYKCPVVFGISDNDLSISLRGHGWVKRSLKTKLEASMQVFMCNGNDMYSIYESMASALEYARVHKRSCAIIFSDLARRFGHAATDRQAAYRSEEEIAGSQQHNPLAVASAMALRDGFTTYDELSALYVQLRETTVNSFAAASAEPKISSRAQLLDRLSQPLATPQQETSLIVSSGYHTENSTKGQRDVMRKHMSRVFDEQMELDKAMVYLGEGVCSLRQLQSERPAQTPRQAPASRA
jgi:TPP-dependent pyruvate/acetoin dehydrogenase alpha subunit